MKSEPNGEYYLDDNYTYGPSGYIEEANFYDEDEGLVVETTTRYEYDNTGKLIRGIVEGFDVEVAFDGVYEFEY